MHIRSIAIALALVEFARPAVAADPAAAQLYTASCSTCHGANGQGVPQVGPPLKGNDFVKSSDEKAIADTIVKGRQGDQKRYKDIVTTMPPNAIGGKQLQDLIALLKTDLQK
jgi:mono/diheme cytochrome c family protein